MIQRWDIITIGNLSRNRYWGEREDQAYRGAICTCTLIQGDNFRLLVDPSLKEETQMETELFRRTGLHLADIDTVFITHAHGDHHYGLKHFPHARWLAAAPVAELLNGLGTYAKPVEAVESPLLGEIELLHTPGHTQHHYSLRFDWDGYTVVVAADAAVTRDFWTERRGYFNSEDFAAATQTIERLASLADILVPGHDNYFFVRK
jgi:glyoxylase-like metal-dependent hydrolase (beta-lactamase superfamily II)